MNIKLIFLPTILVFSLIHASEVDWEGFDDSVVLKEKSTIDSQKAFDWNEVDSEDFDSNYYQKNMVQDQNASQESDFVFELSRNDYVQNAEYEKKLHSLYGPDVKKIYKKMNEVQKIYKKVDENLNRICFEISHVLWLYCEQINKKVLVYFGADIENILAPSKMPMKCADEETLSLNMKKNLDQGKRFFNAQKKIADDINSAAESTLDWINSVRLLVNHFELGGVKIPDIELFMELSFAPVEKKNFVFMDKPNLLDQHYDEGTYDIFGKIDNIYWVFRDLNYCVNFYKKRHIFLMKAVAMVWQQISKIEKNYDCCGKKENENKEDSVKKSKWRKKITNDDPVCS